jgi:hypothetical protein
VSDVVLAVRWTAEMNRQLVHASAQSGALPSLSASAAPPRRIDALRGGGDSDVVYRIPLPPQQQRQSAAPDRRDVAAAGPAPSSSSSPELTIFHAKRPRVSPNRQLTGISRWGPDLSPYLEHLLGVLGLNPSAASRGGAEAPSSDAGSLSSTVLTLALLYADRAASVETPRSNGCPAVPYLAPRTCHRILLASVLLAYEAVFPVTNPTAGSDGTRTVPELYRRVSESLGLPPQDLHQMVAWLKGALGDPGWFVAPDELLEFQQLWDSAFGGRAVNRQVEDAGVAAAPPGIAGGDLRHLEESSSPWVDASTTFVSTPVTYVDGGHHSASGQASEISDGCGAAPPSLQRHQPPQQQQQHGNNYSPPQAMHASY